MDQTACKPGSVPSTPYEKAQTRRSFLWTARRRAVLATNPGAWAGEARQTSDKGDPARRPYSVLLQAGLAMPSRLPGTRWALTPPFHPYRPELSKEPTNGGLLSVALSLGSPPAGVTRRLFTVEPGLSSPSAFEGEKSDRPAV